MAASRVRSGLRTWSLLALLICLVPGTGAADDIVLVSASFGEPRGSSVVPAVPIDRQGEPLPPPLDQPTEPIARGFTTEASVEPGRISPFRLLEDHWRRAADPEIEIAFSQSYQSSGAKKEKKWYEKLGIRGYAQFRINAVPFLNDGSAPAQYVGDRSVGANQNFLIRRARVIIFGDVGDHLYVYLQPDFASSIPGSPDANQYAQIRDWYGDVYLTTDKVHRVRVGASKVPYGWENLQSSSNRLPLDRTDPMNSAVRNERDLGSFYYWTPEWAQDFFKDVMDLGLKGSGNYGVFGLGFYNGQGGSFVEQNENLHTVVRLTLPYTFENCQRMELGIQAYTGLYTVLSSPIRPLGVGDPVRPGGTLETGNVQGIRDERLGWTAVWYPQPLGFQAEWNIGRGPALNAAQTLVEERALNGGYAMSMLKIDTARWGTMFPFLRYNYFQGGYKAERNAPFSRIDEWELGNEWQWTPQVELTGGYTFTDRTNTTALSSPGSISYRQFNGHLIRVQLQINY